FETGDSTQLAPGDWVIAAGNPFKVADGDEPVSVALGVFSTRAPLDARLGVNDFPFHGEVLVIDAVTSNPGAPGSALVDLDGQWIGMIGRVVVSNATRTQFNYAVPAEVCRAFIERVLHPTTAIAQDSAAPAGNVYHGIKLFKQGYKRSLAYVEKVSRGSPAEKAGVRPDDLILTANGRQIAALEDFDHVLESARPGQKLELVLERKRQVITTTLTLEEKPQ
ncbi:MAG TPA: S1C family serine protease, partial [Phycisphaerae bacterium]